MEDDIKGNLCMPNYVDNNMNPDQNSFESKTKKDILYYSEPSSYVQYGHENIKVSFPLDDYTLALGTVYTCSNIGHFNI